MGGVFSLSGYLFEKTEIKNKALNIGLMHGDEDQVVSYQYAWSSYQRLINDKEINTKTFVEEDVGHTVTEPELDLLAEWFHEFNEKNQ